MNIEGMIAILCLTVFIFTGNTELLKICGIFSIASYLEQIKADMVERVEE